MGLRSNRITEEQQVRARTDDPNVRICLLSTCGEKYSRVIGVEGPASFAVRKYCCGLHARAGRREEALARPCPKGHPRDGNVRVNGHGGLECAVCKADRDRNRRAAPGYRPSPSKARRRPDEPVKIFPGPERVQVWRPSAPGW